MNLICKLLGHKWRDTSSRQYICEVNHSRTWVECWVEERHCDRCNIDETISEKPLTTITIP